MAIKIVIDPGHGGYDNGASYKGRKEKDDVLKLGLEVGRLLEQMGYDVSYTRTTDVYDSPVQKARIANELGANYFVSIHRNSSPNENQYNGVQTLIYNDTGIKKDIATNINRNLEDIGFRNINVDKRPDLAVLRRTKMPAVLVEVGFINSDIDNKLFDDNFNAIAKGIADGINDTIKGKNVARSFEDKIEINRIANMVNMNDTTAITTSDDNTNVDYDSATKDKCSCEDESARYINIDSEIRVKDNCNYQVLIGIFRSFGSASYRLNRIVEDGYDGEIVEVDGLYQVRVGDFSNIEDAIVYQRELRDRGYETLIVC